MLRNLLLVFMTVCFIFAAGNNMISKSKFRFVHPVCADMSTLAAHCIEHTLQLNDLKKHFFPNADGLSSTVAALHILITTSLIAVFYLFLQIRNNFKLNHLRAPPAV